MKNSVLFLLVSGLVFSCLPQVNAAAVTWVGGNGNWGSAQGDANANWSGGTVPVANDDVTINPAATTVVNYDTALYIDATTDLRTFSLGNSTVGQTTTLNVSANFQLATAISGFEFTVGPRGIWNQTAGNTQINNDVLIDGGTLQSTGGTVFLLASGFGQVAVRNGGSINITGGNFTNGNAAPINIGDTGTGSFTLGGTATNTTQQMQLKVGNGTTGTGTVTYSSSATNNAMGQRLNVENGVFNHSTGAGNVGFASISAANTPALGVVQIGTGAGTGEFNKDSTAMFVVTATGTGGRGITVGANGTMNWAAGDIFSNEADDEVVNQGEWNYTRASGISNYRYGPEFNNEGTFNWEGAGGLNLNPAGAQGAGTFVNDGLLATSHDGQVTLQADLLLGGTGTFNVGLGLNSTTGLLVTGTNGGAITLGGTLSFTNIGGMLFETEYDILQGAFSGSFSSVDPFIQIVDDGSLSGVFTIQIIPEPGTASLFLAAGAAFFCLRQRRIGRS